jgi:hypothetical protein
MSDHVFDPCIAARLQAQGARDPGRVHLATDAAIADVFDLDDATKVRVEGDSIREIGKGWRATRAWTSACFIARRGSASSPDRRGLGRALGVGRHAAGHLRGRAPLLPDRALFWQDVDTPEMLQEARRRLRVVGDALREPRERKGLASLRRVGLPIAVALLAWVISRQPFAEIGRAVSALEWSVLGLLAFPLLWYASNTLGLWLVVRRRVSLRSLFFNRVAGEGFKALLPLAGFGGEPFKARHLGRWLPRQEAAALVVASRLIEELSGVSFAGACLVFSGRALHLSEVLRTTGTVLGLVLVVAGVAGTAVLSGRAPERLVSAAIRLVRRKPAGCAPAPLGMGRVLGAFALHLVGRLAGFLEVVFLLHLLGVDATAQAAAGVMALLLLSGVATIVFPQGLGALEAASVFALGLLGQPAALGVAFGLLRRARMLVYGALGSALGSSRCARRRPAWTSSFGRRLERSGDRRLAACSAWNSRT